MTDEQVREIDTMQEFLQDTFDKDPSVYVDRLRLINTYMARTGVLLAVAKMELNQAVECIYAKDFEMLKKLTPTQTKEYIKAKTNNEGFYVDLLDRMNANCVHQSDNLRTLLSYEKAQMQLT